MEAIAQYSASVMDRAIVVYFLEDQEMQLTYKKTQKPMVLCLVIGQPTQLVLLKVVREVMLCERKRTL